MADSADILIPNAPWGWEDAVDYWKATGATLDWNPLYVRIRGKNGRAEHETKNSDQAVSVHPADVAAARHPAASLEVVK